MSKGINHWCVVCGKGYHACDSCNDTKSFAPWRTYTDSIEHFKVFAVLKDYRNNMIDKKEAKRLLSNIDLSDRDTFEEGSKKLLNDIFKEDVVERKSNKKKLDAVVKVEVVKDVEKTDVITVENDTEE